MKWTNCFELAIWTMIKRNRAREQKHSPVGSAKIGWERLQKADRLGLERLLSINLISVWLLGINQLSFEKIPNYSS